MQSRKSCLHDLEGCNEVHCFGRFCTLKNRTTLHVECISYSLQQNQVTPTWLECRCSWIHSIRLDALLNLCRSKRAWPTLLHAAYPYLPGIGACGRLVRKEGGGASVLGPLVNMQHLYTRKRDPPTSSVAAGGGDERRAGCPREKMHT
jgi:hypothetical protein